MRPASAPPGCIAALAACACAVAAHGAGAADIPGPSADRPRVGLALSGGGARGIAHVGVLKVLDEMRVPIDCVTGTSMGAIVGGTFAAGTPPETIEKLVHEADWNELFRDAPPRQEISMRRKADDYKTLFKPEFGVKDGSLALPKGIIAGVAIEAFFRVLAEPAIGVSDFRQLPIPFAAMATDIETGASIVLDKGSVAQAMRASMAVPGAIAPVEIDGRLLVDGGIANNLPIDEARRLCGDVIIAVNISTAPLKRADLNSALAVSLQLINFLGKQTVDEQLRRMRPDDVLIAPDLGDITASSFERSKEAVRIGEQFTRALASKLARYSVPPEQYATIRARQLRDRVALGAVDEIRFEGLERTNAEVLRGLVTAKPGEPLTEEQIGADLRRIYGRGDFESIDYRIEGQPGGPRAMVITPREKSWGPDYLRFGLGLESDFEGGNAFNALVQYRRSWLNRLGGEWLAELQIGQDTHLLSEIYQPLHERGEWFASVHGIVGRTTRPVFSGDDKVAEYRVTRAGGGIDLGRVLGTSGAVRVGAVWNEIDARVETGDPVLPKLRELTAGGRMALSIDQLDHPWFAQSGYLANVVFYGATNALGSAQNYQKLSAEARYAKSWGAHTVAVAVSGGTDFGTEMPAYEQFVLGGPLRLSGFRVGQFAGREFAFGRAMYYRRIFALPDILGSGVYAGASAEVGHIADRVDGLPTPGTLWSGSVFLGADTFAGPGYLGFGFGTGGSYSLYLLLGAP